MLGLFGFAKRAAKPFPQQATETKSLASPDAWLLELFGTTPAASGIPIAPRKAMQCAPVRCAVQAISETVGQLPIITYSRDASGAKERAPDHPAYSLLHDAPSEWVPANLFKEELTRDALLDKYSATIRMRAARQSR